MYTQDGWKELQHLNKDIDTIAVPLQQYKNKNIEIDEKWLGNSVDVVYLLGQLYGDGNKGTNIASEENHDILYKWIKMMNSKRKISQKKLVQTDM